MPGLKNSNKAIESEVNMKLTVSKGNSKIGKIANVSLIPVKDCVNCHACKKDCYALKAFKQYPNVRQAWQGNSELLRKRPIKYYNDLMLFLSTYKGKFFRFHVAGDIINKNHFLCIAGTAKAFPNIKFLIFTKSFDFIIPSIIPDNLTVVLSLFPGMGIPNKLKSFPRAYAGECKGKRFKNAMECIGYCDKCYLCWNLKELKKDVKFNIH